MAAQPISTTTHQLAAARALLEQEGFLVLTPDEATALQRALNQHVDGVMEIREMTMRSRAMVAMAKVGRR